MQRRTLIQSLIAAVPLKGLRLWAQTATFPGPHLSTLKELAATVLPEALGAKGTEAVATQFVRWVREYRVGAEMQAGYGYPDARREKIAAALTEAGVTNLPNSPDGKHVASDLMSLYFMSPDANDRAYGARIGKDQCRGLKTSAAVPPPLRTK
jgi:hypothetical protein